MIQIDDSGSGSLLGGTFIGAIRVETHEYKYSVIPLCLYTKDRFDKKYYQYYVVEIIKKLLNELNVSKTELIEICQGYIFDQARIWLKQNNYNFVSKKISDPLQTEVEETFTKYLLSLGVPEQFLSYTKYPFHFHSLLKWVYADYSNRSMLCKQGWQSWSKYRNREIKEYTSYLKKSTFICLLCGNKINNNSEVIVKEYFTNRLNKVYTHKNCFE